MKNWIYTLGICLSIVSCSESVKRIEKKAIIASLTEGGFHTIDTAHHYEIDLKYPVIDANVPPDILVNINNIIPEKFESFVHKKEFVESHLDLPNEFYSGDHDWLGILTNTYSAHQADSILFINFSVYQYFIGAAHGSTFQHSLQFDLSTGEEINYTNFLNTDKVSLQTAKALFNANLPDSVCWGIRSDSAIIKNLNNVVFIQDSIVFYVDDYSLCPYAFGIPDIRFSREQFSSILKTPQFQYFSELIPVVAEGEIATH